MPAGPTLMGRFGTSMLARMVAAFACELAMKSILLTRNDEATFQQLM